MMDIKAQRILYKDTIDVLMLTKHQDGSFDVVDELIIQHLQPGQVVSRPSLELTNTEAQQFMDELWGCGLRPSEGTGSAGQLAATERHLKDMQRLVFKDKP